jgi:hypothetical protein
MRGKIPRSTAPAQLNFAFLTADYADSSDWGALAAATWPVAFGGSPEAPCDQRFDRLLLRAREKSAGEGVLAFAFLGAVVISLTV